MSEISWMWFNLIYLINLDRLICMLCSTLHTLYPYTKVNCPTTYFFLHSLSVSVIFIKTFAHVRAKPNVYSHVGYVIGVSKVLSFMCDVRSLILSLCQLTVTILHKRTNQVVHFSYGKTCDVTFVVVFFIQSRMQAWGKVVSCLKCQIWSIFF